MWKRFRTLFPFWKRRLELPDEGQELETVENGSLQKYGGTCSNLVESTCDVTDVVGDVPPVFSAIQQYDIDDLKRLLQETPDLVNEIRCGGLSPLHAACHIKSLQILQIILQYGALVSIFDDVGNTALHIAVREGWHDGVAELLRWGASPDIKCQPVEIFGDSLAETPLHAAIRNGDQTSTSLILKYSPDLTLRDSNQCSVLHLAAKSANVEIVKQLLQEKICQELLTTVDCKGNSMMHAAVERTSNTCRQTLNEILRAFFEAGVNVNSLNHLNESPIFCAARAGLHEAVEFLLSLGSEIQILTNKRQSLLHGACLSGSTQCLKHLLNTGCLYSYVTLADDDDKEPFHYAVLSCSIECCELLLNNGDHLTRIDKNGDSRCSLILDYLPSATELLENMFDSCINLSDKPQHDPDFRIGFDYSVLLSPAQNSPHSLQSSLISDLSNNDLSESFLKHPLVESFLFWKWSKIRIFFYLNVVIFFIFLVLHSFYIISFYRKEPMRFSKDIFNVWVFRFLHMFMYFLIVVPEAIVAISQPKRFVRHWESLTKLLSLISSAFVVFSQENTGQKMDSGEFGFTNSTNITTHVLDDGEMPFQRQMAATSAFFGWVELMMLCGRFPSLGVYALMLTRIAKSMVFFVLAFATLLIGFAICFMVLFCNKESFATFFLSIVKTLMMMVGEIDYEGLVNENPPVLGYVMLVAFMFLVCILVVNLLIGLAVNDISNLELLGKIKRLSKQASFLVSLEQFTAFVRSWNVFPHSLYVFISNFCDIKPRIDISLNKRRFKTNWKYKIPAEIIEAALTIGNSKRDSFSAKTGQNTKWFTNKAAEMQTKLDKIVKILETLHPEESPQSDVKLLQPHKDSDGRFFKMKHF